ncbi:MAG: FAD-dependent oxidoreductase, partial [Oscillospiraceae bacterium]|nr:FAD-dependent oxidoreductase [Oscillospiraceae bacterium]
EFFDGGYDISGGVEFAKQLDGHADLIHVSAGNCHAPGNSIAFTHPGIFKEGGCNVHLAAEIKKHVKTPVATVGGLCDPDELEDIIASGKADIVVMARGLIVDPDLPNKARTGREKEIRHCLRCFTCVHEMYEHGRLFCAINPESGKDCEISDALPLKEGKRVLVAGGGMAGMEAAITAAKEGHKVILCEKSDSLGGVLRCETAVPFKKPIGLHIERQKYMIEKSGIELRLNTEVTPELCKQLQPDVIIAAIGAKPAVPPIKGIDGKNVLLAEKAFANPELVGKSAVILGAGLTGQELGIYLGGLGKTVTLVEKDEKKTGRWEGGHMAQLANVGAAVKYEHEVVEITEKGVTCRTKDGDVFVEADTVIVALGLKPLWDEAEAISYCAGEFYQVGDCRAPRNILAATGEGWTAAKQAGRF